MLCVKIPWKYVKWGSNFETDFWQFFWKLNIQLLPDSFLGKYSRKLKAYVHTKTCTQMFKAVLIATPKWKHPICLSAVDWINKMWCMHTVEYYWAIKRNELGSISVLGFPSASPSHAVHLGICGISADATEQAEKFRMPKKKVQKWAR
jgi:hypothetical protein